jgi:hypothetical protein
MQSCHGLHGVISQKTILATRIPNLHYKKDERDEAKMRTETKYYLRHVGSGDNLQVLGGDGMIILKLTMNESQGEL